MIGCRATAMYTQRMDCVKAPSAPKHIKHFQWINKNVFLLDFATFEVILFLFNQTIIIIISHYNPQSNPLCQMSVGS